MATVADRLLAFDRECSRGGARLLAGVDEAGRGSWAGPVVAAAAMLPADWCPSGLDDSKRLTAARRDELFRELRDGALAWGACAVDARVIDSVNILAATLRAMALACARLRVRPDLVLVDGLQVPAIECEARALVKGDATSAAIAAASVIAKVLRDRVMIAWDRRYPGYGFAANKGYGAPVHRAALQRLGPCPLHRASYAPVAAYAQRRLWNGSC
ncbi:MAG TPA: ribonuclease HII [Candidatus Krumholzibacteria bacterium]|nr:ribonuclease HII [Candidatus Krumholzibacteria bacterium]HPD71389.1 ribonuclease HII [Candidatus Krumholzibacteria bacterium]HRY38911.1 ribonuclease HII [Candidatus Krumholzibacteria bacterium]